MSIKLVVLYPNPTDPETFEKAYMEEHVPLARKTLSRLERFTGARVLFSPAGPAPYYWVAELYYPSIEALQADFSTPEAQVLNAHAASISTGGIPVALICTELLVQSDQ